MGRMFMGFAALIAGSYYIAVFRCSRHASNPQFALLLLEKSAFGQLEINPRGQDV